MQDKSTYSPPSQVPVGLIQKFCDQLHLYLQQSIADVAVGPEVLKHVERTVPPSARSHYSDLPSASRLLVLEVEEIGVRIRRYQYIERYKFFLDVEEEEVRLAFSEHLYEARAGQVYTILERGSKAVRFACAIGSAIRNGNGRAVAQFMKQFRAKFEHRLRERHRQSHAHERPSLSSRILALRGETDEDKQAISEVLMGMFAFAAGRLEELRKKRGATDLPSPTDPNRFQSWYLTRVDEEAALMWQIFSDSISSAVGLSDVR